MNRNNYIFGVFLLILPTYQMAMNCSKSTIYKKNITLKCKGKKYHIKTTTKMSELLNGNNEILDNVLTNSTSMQDIKVTLTGMSKTLNNKNRNINQKLIRINKNINKINKNIRRSNRDSEEKRRLTRELNKLKKRKNKLIHTLKYSFDRFVECRKKDDFLGTYTINNKDTKKVKSKWNNLGGFSQTNRSLIPQSRSKFSSMQSKISPQALNRCDSEFRAFRGRLNVYSMILQLNIASSEDQKRNIISSFLRNMTGHNNPAKVERILRIFNQDKRKRMNNINKKMIRVLGQ